MVDKYYVRNFLLMYNAMNKEKNAYFKINADILDDIINKQLYETLKQYAPPNFYSFFDSLKSKFQIFTQFLKYETLLGKNIISIGGNKNSLKSQFINEFFNEKIFTSDVDESEVVPIYITNGEKLKLQATNLHGRNIKIEPYDIPKICEGFPDLEDFEDNVYKVDSPISHMIKSICVESKNVKTDNLAFLNAITYNKRKDNSNCKNQLQAGDFTIWCVNSSEETISKDEMDFLKNAAGEKLIVVTNSFAKQTDDLKYMRDEIKDILNLNGVSHVDVLAYSKLAGEDFDNDKIKSVLDGWNKIRKSSYFAKSFKASFMEVTSFYEKEISFNQRNISRLNAILKTIDNSEDKNILSINEIISDFTLQLNRLTEIFDKFNSLQNTFFKELNILGNELALNMPELSEIDLSAGNKIDCIALVKSSNYVKKNNNQQTFFEILGKVNSQLVDVKFASQSGQCSYKERLQKKVHTVDDDDNKFKTQSGQVSYKERLEKKVHTVDEEEKKFKTQSGQVSYNERLEKKIHVIDDKDKKFKTQSGQVSYNERLQKKVHTVDEEEKKFKTQSWQVSYKERLEKKVHVIDDDDNKFKTQSGQVSYNERLEKKVHTVDEEDKKFKTQSGQVSYKERLEKKVHAIDDDDNKFKTQSGQVSYNERLQKKVHAIDEEDKKFKTQSGQCSYKGRLVETHTL